MALFGKALPEYQMIIIVYKLISLLSFIALDEEPA